MPGTEDESANGRGLSSLTSVIFEEEQQRLAAETTKQLAA